MNIGDAATATGISVKMLRHYEGISLVRPALRTLSGYRVYGDNDLRALRFVRRARDLGFQVKQIAALLGLWRSAGRASADVKAMALAHARELEARRRELDVMIVALRGMAATCLGDDRPDCAILATLGDGVETSSEPTEARPQSRLPRSGFAYVA